MGLAAILGAALVSGALQRMTTGSFNATIGATPIALVAFTAPWCGHCQKLKPELAAAAAELLADGVSVIEVDATAERKLAHRFDVRAFPELLVHRADLGTFVKYAGPRQAQGIVAHMRARLGPACVPLTEATVEEWLRVSAPPTDRSPFVLRVLALPHDGGSGADSHGSVELEQLERAAEGMRLQVRCATPAGTPLAPATRVRVSFARAFPRAFAASEGDALPPTVHFEGEGDAAGILRWLALHSRPAVGELNEETARAYVGMRDTAVAVLLLPSPVASRLRAQKDYYAQQLHAVAQAVTPLAGPPVFLTVCHSAGRIGQQLVGDYRIDATVPTLLLLDFTKRARKPAGHRLDQPFDVRAAIEHVAAFKAGKFAGGTSVLERIGHWLEWLFVLVADNTFEAVAATVGVFVALLGASVYLDRQVSPPGKLLAAAAASTGAPAGAADKKLN